MDDGLEAYYDDCPNCGQQIEHTKVNVGSNKYPKLEWSDGGHSPNDCIQYLRERLEKIESFLVL